MANEKTQSNVREPLGGDVDTWLEDNPSPFIFARMGDEGPLRRMLSDGMPADVRNDDGQTCLILAAAAGHEGVVSRFLEAGADVHAADAHQRTAASLAASFGHRVVLRMLLDRGVSSNSRDSRGRTLLMLAAANAQSNCVELLINRGASILLRDKEGNGALAHAMLAGDDPSVHLIEAAGRTTGPGFPANLDSDLLLEPADTGVRETPISVPPVSREAFDMAVNLQMVTPLPRPDSRANEPDELLSQLVQDYCDLGVFLETASRALHENAHASTIEAAALRVSIRTQIVRELLLEYDVASGKVRAPVVPFRMPRTISLDDVVVALDAAAEKVNWGVMILDSHGDDAGAEMLRDARRELARGAQSLRLSP
jgi:hypothetical protein